MGGAAAAMQAARMGWLNVVICVVLGFGIGIFLVYLIKFLGYRIAQIILAGHVPGEKFSLRVTLGLGFLHLFALVCIPIAAIIGSNAIALIIGLLPN